MRLDVGQQVQEFKVVQLRGKGTGTAVWEVEDPAGRHWALKLIPCTDEAARQELRAIQNVGRLEHHHLVPLEKVWSVAKFFLVVMPLADASLQDLFEAYQSEYGTGIEPRELCQLLAQAARAIDYLNMENHHLGSWPGGIQHCNIKPTNLLLFGDVLKLSDFGLASPTVRMVQFGGRLNSPMYAAPEVYQGRLTNWTDQFALAAVYVHMRSGRPAFTTLPEPGQLTYVRPAPDLSMLTDKERPIIARALANIPHERWKSCSELIGNLLKAVISDR
jgi:serine/threonine protein kinase